MTTWHDSQLMRMSRDQEDILFPVLNRSEGFKALLFVLALIPGLMAMYQSQVTVVQTEFAVESLSLFSNESVVGAGWLPHALTGAVLLLPQFYLSQLLAIPVLISGFLLICALYLSASSLLNSRCGLFAVLVFLFHPLWIEQLHFPVTPVLSSMLGLFCLWGYYRHLQQERLFSPWLLASVLAAALNLLSLPVLTFMILLGMLLECVLFGGVKMLRPGLFNSGKKANMLSDSVRFRLMSWLMLVAMNVCCGLLFLILRENYQLGLWRELSLFERYFQQAEIDWLAWCFAIWEAEAFQTGVLILGLVISGKELLRSFSWYGSYLAIWTLWGLFGLLWLMTGHSDLFPEEMVQTFRVMFLSMSMFVIAIGLDAVQLRKIGLREVLVLMCLGLVIMVAQSDRLPSLPKTISQWIVVLAIPFVIWQLLRLGAKQERYQRMILQGCLVLFFLVNTAVGWFFIQPHDYLVEPYNRFQSQTASIQDVQTCLVIGSPENNQILECLIAVNWLGTEIIYFDSWSKGIEYLKSSSAEEGVRVLFVDTTQNNAPTFNSALPNWKQQSTSELFQFPQFTLQCYELARQTH